MFDFFQKFPRSNRNHKSLPENDLASSINIEKHFWSSGFGYIDVQDYAGFTNERTFYKDMTVSYIEYFNEHGQLSTRIYYDTFGIPVLTYYFHPDSGKQPVVAMIKLTWNDTTLYFNNENELFSYFLDLMVIEANSPTVLFIDREDVGVESALNMHQDCKLVLVLHSVFTENTQPGGHIFDLFKKALFSDKFSAFIAATKSEVIDVHKRGVRLPGFVIPPSFINDSIMNETNNQHDPNKVIMVDRITPLKQIEHTIRAIATLHAEFSSLTLDIWGYGNNPNDPYFQSLLQLTKELSVADIITFKGYEADLSTVYQQAGVLILTSQYEGFSMAVLEALSHGCPIISYDIRYGPSDMIQDGQNGLLLEPNNVAKLTEKIHQFLFDPDLQWHLYQNARTITHHFSQNRGENTWKNLLDSLNP